MGQHEQSKGGHRIEMNLFGSEPRYAQLIHLFNIHKGETHVPFS